MYVNIYFVELYGFEKYKNNWKIYLREHANSNSYTTSYCFSFQLDNLHNQDIKNQLLPPYTFTWPIVDARN